jgi:hypothetical protein
VAKDLVAVACEESVQISFARRQVGQGLDGHGFGFFNLYVRFALTLSITRFRSSADIPFHREAPPLEAMFLRSCGVSDAARALPPFRVIHVMNFSTSGCLFFLGLIAP